MILLALSFLPLLAFFFFPVMSLSKNLFSLMLSCFYLSYMPTVSIPLLVFLMYTSDLFIFPPLDLAAFLLSFCVISTCLLSSSLCSAASLTSSSSSLPPPSLSVFVCPSLSCGRLWMIWSRGWRRQASRSAFARVSSPTRLSLSRTSRCFD